MVPGGSASFQRERNKGERVGKRSWAAHFAHERFVELFNSTEFLRKNIPVPTGQTPAQNASDSANNGHSSPICHSMYANLMQLFRSRFVMNSQELLGMQRRTMTWITFLPQSSIRPGSRSESFVKDLTRMPSMTGSLMQESMHNVSGIGGSQ